MIDELFESAKQSLSLESMKRLRGCFTRAECDAGNVAKTLNLLASFYASDSYDVKFLLPDEETLADILWGLSYRVEYIGELIRIGEDAAQLVKEMEGDQVKS